MAYLPAPVLRLAEPHFGVVTRDDLLALNVDGVPVTRGMVRGWLARGHLEKLYHGVYRLPGTSHLPGQRHYAALRRSGPGARLGGPSALAFLGAEGFSLRDTEPFIVVPPGRRLSNVDVRWIAAPVSGCDAAGLAGNLPGVTPTRALIDAAGVVPPKRFRVAYDDFRRRGLTSSARLVERAHDLLDVVPGAAAALELANSGALDKESEGERELATIFLPTDPWPLWQVWVLADVRVDALFPEARLAPEYYGKQHHSIDRDQQRDHDRAARLLREIDVEIMVIRAHDLRDRRALRSQILERRAERIRAGVAPLRDFHLDRG